MRKFTTKQLLSLGAMLFVFTILLLMMFVELPENNREIFNTTFGMVIGGSIVLAYTYYFGDSDKVGGTQEKEE